MYVGSTLFNAVFIRPEQVVRFLLCIQTLHTATHDMTLHWTSRGQIYIFSDNFLKMHGVKSVM